MRKVKIHLNRVSFFYSPLRFTAKRVRQSALVFRVKAARNPKGKPNGFAQRSRPITYCTAYLLRSASGTVPGQVSKRGLHLLLRLNTIASPFLFYCWCLRKYILKKVWVVRISANSIYGPFFFLQKCYSLKIHVSLQNELLSFFAEKNLLGNINGQCSFSFKKSKKLEMKTNF